MKSEGTIGSFLSLGGVGFEEYSVKDKPLRLGVCALWPFPLTTGVFSILESRNSVRM